MGRKRLHHAGRQQFADPPTYRKHKPAGQAIVTLDRRMRHLGMFGRVESQAKYMDLVNEWIDRGRAAPAASELPDVNGLMVANYHRVETHYRKPSGEPTSELATIRLCLRVVRQL